jgi:hypothetical protein
VFAVGYSHVPRIEYFNGIGQLQPLGPFKFHAGYDRSQGAGDVAWRGKRGGEAALHFHRALARGGGCRNPWLARINAINSYVHRRTDGPNSLRYGQGIVVRQRPPVLANLFGQWVSEGKRARTHVIKGATMIANPAIPYPGSVPHPFTLNDLRVHNTIAEEPSSTSALTLSGLALAVVLAIGALIWLLLTPTETSSPAPAIVPSAEPARPTERREIIAPLTPVPATKSVEVPVAPSPVVRAPQVPAPVVRPRATSIKPESRGNPMDKTNTTVRQASPKEKTAPVLLTMPEEKTAPPALLTKPEEMTDAPIVPKLADDTKNAPKPAAANDQTPVTE